MFVVHVAVQQADRERLNPVLPGRRKIGAKSVKVDRFEHIPVRIQSLANLDDIVRQWSVLSDIQCE